MASLANAHTVPEHAFLLIGSGESKRTVEESDFDYEGYEKDRLLFINQGMTVIAGEANSDAST